MEVTRSWSGLMFVVAILTCVAGTASGQSSFPPPLYGFHLTAGNELMRTVTPTGVVSLYSFWAKTGSMDVKAVRDGSVVIYPDAGSKRDASHPPPRAGTAAFTLRGQDLTPCRHTLVLEATPSGGSTTHLFTVLHNEEPISGLEMGGLSTRTELYTVVNSTMTMSATVVSGSCLTAEWFLDTYQFVYQTYRPADKTVTFTRFWDAPTTIPIMLIVSNHQDALAYHFQLFVVNGLNGISISHTNVTTTNGQQVTVSLLFASDIVLPIGFITVNVTWEALDVQMYTLGNAVSPNMVQPYSHTYTVQGDYDVEFSVLSPIDSLTFDVFVRIWDELNVEIVTSVSAANIGEVITLTFANTPFSGFQYVIDYGIGTLTNDRSALFAAYAAPNPPLTISFSSGGVYVVSLHAFNDMYSSYSNKTLIVQAPITGDHVALSPASDTVALPDGIARLTLNVINNTVVGETTCSWDFGEAGSATPGEYVEVPADFPVKKVFQYNSGGVFTVTVSCANNVSSLVLMSTVTVERWLMTDFTLDVDSPLAMNGTNVAEPTAFDLALPRFLNPPAGLRATFTYGDGSPDEMFNVTGWNFSHKYPMRGDYSGSLFLEHELNGNEAIPFNVRLGIFQLSVSPTGGLVVTQVFDFIANVPAGFNGSATVDFGDGTSASSPTTRVGNDWVYSYTYMLVDYYYPFLSGTWLTETEVLSFGAAIEVDGPVADLDFTVTPNPVLFPPGEVQAILVLTRALHEMMFVTCFFNFKEALDPEPRMWNGTVNPGDSIVVPFQYLSVGQRDVDVSCFNNYSSITLSAYSETFNPCFSEDSIFDRQHSTWHTPMYVLSSEDLLLLSRTVVLCTSVPNFYWQIYNYTEYGHVLHELDLLQPNVDFLFIQKGGLDPGLYRMDLNISFGPEHDFFWLKESTFIEILPTPPVAEIKGGSIRVTGNNQDVIDARELSYDPVYGVNDKNGLKFLWQCKRFGTETIEELMPSTSQRKYNDMGTCDDVSIETEPGVRRLRLDSPDGILFEVTVTKAGAISIPATLFLQFDPSALSTELRCVVNCDIETAVSSTVVLKVDCATCSAADMLDADYMWALSILNETTGQYDIVPNLHSFMLKSGYDRGPEITLAEKNLEPCRRYRLRVRMTSATSGSSGFSVREFVTNCPPWGGTCELDPSEGDVMTQRFTLTCSGWHDNGFMDPTNVTSDGTNETVSLYYKFLLRKNGILIFMAEGGESNMPRSQLPLIPGQAGTDYEMVVRIYDSRQDYTEVVLPVKLYKNESAQNLTEFILGPDFWGQPLYTTRSSTILKELNALIHTSSLLASYELPEFRSQLEQAARGSVEDGSNIVNQDWEGLWTDINTHVQPEEKKTLTRVLENFAKMVCRRREDVTDLAGFGLLAVGEGMTTILYNPDTTSTEAVTAALGVADKASEALVRLYNTRPYPIGAKLPEAVFSLLGVVDRVLKATLPTYDTTTLGSDPVFNSSDTGEDENMFLIKRTRLAATVEDEHRIENSRTIVPQVEKILDTMLDTMLSSTALGQPAKTVDRDSVALVAGKMTGRSLDVASFTAKNFNLKLDTIDEDGAESDRDATVEIKASVFQRNPFAWSVDGSSYGITSPVVKLDLKDKKGHRKLRRIDMGIRRNADGSTPSARRFSSDDTRAGPDNLIYHRVDVQSGSAVVTYFQPPAHVTKVVAYFRHDRAPTLARHDYRIEGEEITSRRRRAAVTDPQVMAGTTAATTTFATNYTDDNSTSPNETDTDASSGDGAQFKFFVPAGSLSPGPALVGFEMPELGNETVDYQYMTFTDSCRVWNEKEMKWDASSCQVSAFSTSEETFCSCDNPPGMSFATAFFVAPNTIDFDLVFSKFDVTNASVYGTLIGLLLVWILALVWARRKDKQDRERWLVGYLKDNLADDSYFYLLTVYTGMRRGAGTRSNVRFILTGNKVDTGVRTLSDGKRHLDSGTIMTYVMATTEGLGELSHMRVWHDDSGPGEQASWFLGKIIVEDLQSSERFIFVCDKWLAIDKEEGLIDRFLPVATKDDIMTFDKLFTEHARIGVTDSHLWFSCLMRPERSTFTRVQRVSCCMTLLLLVMITSAMFYQPEDNETGESQNKLGMEVRIGIMSFSMTTLWTSGVSIVITAVPTLLFVVLFRSSRPQPGPRARAQQHRREGLIQMTRASKRISEKQEEGENMSDLLNNMLQENPLPHYVTYITWALLLATMATCAFFLLLYSMQWGKTTSEEWLGSFFVSFAESIFVLDPIKVLSLAVVLAFLARNPYANNKLQYVDMRRLQVEAETFGNHEIDTTALPPDPVPESVLEEARRRRKQEQHAQQVFFELLLYSFFVFCIFSISYGSRDERSYYTNWHLDSMLYSAAGTAPVPFETITKREDLYEWMSSTLVETLFPWTDAVGNKLDWRLRLFASDLMSFRVGPVRVRQLRMSNLGEPKATEMFPQLAGGKHTYPPYSMEDEEKGSYCVGWNPPPCSDTEIVTKLSNDAWRYVEVDNVTSMSIWGIFTFYSSAGYAADFAVNRDVVARTIQELQDNDWLDLQTRAVFVEFALYNAYVNLFSFVRLAAEFPEVGSTVVWRDIKTLRIYDHLGPKGAYILLCELIAAVVIIIFTVKLINSLRKMKCDFFKDFWKVLDLLNILISYVALAFYIVKMLNVGETMAKWRQDPKVYLDLYLTVLWDDMYGYILAALVFVVTIRLLRILGYNRRITMVGTVLTKSAVDLLGFGIIFFVVNTAYMCSGIVFFASSLYRFRSVWQSFNTLLLVQIDPGMLGRWISEEPLWAQAYFISLSILVLLIMVTMFAAIMCTTTSIVRIDIMNAPPAYGLTDLVYKFYRATIADWIPAWLIRPNAVVAHTKPGYSACQPPPRYQNGSQTMAYRVLGALVDHFTTLEVVEKEKKKTAKPKRERKQWDGFSSLKSPSTNTLV